MVMDMNVKNLVILGSTGSIGTQALEVAQQAGYRVVGLAAARQVDLLEKNLSSPGPLPVVSLLLPVVPGEIK